MTNKKQEPREWWIQDVIIESQGSSNSYWAYSKPNNYATIQVIEYSALTEAQAELEKYKKLAEELRDVLKQINIGELNSQRPGGYYSKSAILSYDAINTYDAATKGDK
jgi:hypothetical protein